MRVLSLFIFYLLFSLTVNAYAYLDPGTGSYALQMIIAGVVSSLFAVKMCWKKIVDIFSGIFKRKE